MLRISSRSVLSGSRKNYGSCLRRRQEWQPIAFFVNLSLDRVILRFGPDSAEFVGLFCAVFAPSISLGLALAALILDARGGKLPTPADVRGASKAMRQTLRISNQENDELEGSFAFVQFLGDRSLSLAGMKRFLALPTSREARLLMEALGRVDIQYGRVQLVLERLCELEKTDYAPTPLITGDDLAAAGLKPGKLFKRILDEVYDAQPRIEGEFKRTSDGISFADRAVRVVYITCRSLEVSSRVYSRGISGFGHVPMIEIPHGVPFGMTID